MSFGADGQENVFWKGQEKFLLGRAAFAFLLFAFTLTAFGQGQGDLLLFARATMLLACFVVVNVFFFHLVDKIALFDARNPLFCLLDAWNPLFSLLDAWDPLFSLLDDRNRLKSLVFVFWRLKSLEIFSFRLLTIEIAWNLWFSFLDMCVAVFVFWRLKSPEISGFLVFDDWNRLKSLVLLVKHVCWRWAKVMFSALIWAKVVLLALIRAKVEPSDLENFAYIQLVVVKSFKKFRHYSSFCSWIRFLPLNHVMIGQKLQQINSPPFNYCLIIIIISKVIFVAAIDLD